MAVKKRFGEVQLAILILVTLSAAIGWSQSVRGKRKPRFITNGKNTEPFNVTRHTIPLGKIERGGPPRDVIPALNNPRNLTPEQAGRLLKPADRVLGVFLNGQPKAYPIRILNWHELVNDTVRGKPILASW